MMSMSFYQAMGESQMKDKKLNSKFLRSSDQLRNSRGLKLLFAGNIHLYYLLASQCADRSTHAIASSAVGHAVLTSILTVVAITIMYSLLEMGGVVSNEEAWIFVCRLLARVLFCTMS